jgi:hypothetical protein
MGWLRRTFSRVFGPEIPAAQLAKAAEVAGQVFGAPDAKEEAFGLLAGVLPFGLPPRRGTRELLQTYALSPWLRAVVGRVAGRVSQANWHVYALRPGAGSRAVRPIALQRAHGDARRRAFTAATRGPGALTATDQIDHPMLDVIHAGCPPLDGRTVFFLVAVYLQLKGEAFLLIERWEDGPLKGLPRYLWPVPPHWVQETPSVSRPGYRLQWNGFSVWVPETEVVRFTDPDPHQPYGRSAGIGESLADELSADESASKLVDSSFFNRNLPAAIVSMEGGTETEAKRIKEDWSQKYKGVLRAFQTHFTNAKVSVAQLSQTFADQQVLELRLQMRNTILEAFGYPKELLGILEDANRSTIDTAAYRVEKYCVEPWREIIRHVLQLRLMPEWDERGLVEYDNDVPEDRSFTLLVMQARPQAFFDDEARELAGRAPLPDGAGQVRPPASTLTLAVPMPASMPRGAHADPAWVAPRPAQIPSRKVGA